MAAHKYWRVYFPEVGGAPRLIMREIYMRESVGGADVTSGGVPSGYLSRNGDPQNIFDNNTTTTFESNGSSLFWFKYEFATDVEILEFTYNHLSGYYPVKIQLQWSDNDTDWTTVYSDSHLDAWVNNVTQTFSTEISLLKTLEDIDAKVGDAFSFDMDKHFSGGDATSYVLNNAPSWMSIDIHGVITGTPTSEAVTSNVSITKTTPYDSFTSTTFTVNDITTIGRRYFWRMNFTSAATHFYISEIEMRESVGGADVTGGGVVTESSAYSGNVGSYAFDNNSGTYWTPAELTPWLIYEFPSSVSIEELTVAITAKASDVTGLSIDYSNDGITWDRAYTATGLPVGTWESPLVPLGIYPEFKGPLPSIDVMLGTGDLSFDTHRHFKPQGGDPISYTLFNAPSWMNIDNDGIITGTPPSSGQVTTGVYVEAEYAVDTVQSNTFPVNVISVAGQHPYWRISVISEYRDTIYEIEIRASAGGADQCNGGAAYASNSRPPAVPSSAFDNNVNTAWQKETVAGWLSYHFLGYVYCEQVSINVNAITKLTDFDIEYSYDGITWYTFFEVRGEPAWDHEIRLFDSPLPPTIIVIGCPGQA